MKFNIVFVGAGGTGTYVLKEFSRYLLENSVLDEITAMSIIDGDFIEKKNLKRQSFMEEDIGKNKASVMATVLNSAFQLNYKAYAKYITSVEELEELLPQRKGVLDILVSCVDNHGARMLFEAYFEKSGTGSMVYIDSANEFSDGECVVAVKAEGHVIAPCRSYYYPHIKKGDLRQVTEMSCEELNNVAPQHILANMQSALHILANLIRLLETGNITGGFSIFDVFKKFGKEYPYVECGQ